MSSDIVIPSSFVAMPPKLSEETIVLVVNSSYSTVF